MFVFITFSNYTKNDRYFKVLQKQMQVGTQGSFRGRGHPSSSLSLQKTQGPPGPDSQCKVGCEALARSPGGGGPQHEV